MIHQKNSGVSKARNRVIESAKGDYLVFIDSDDYIEKNNFEQIANVQKSKSFT